MTNEELKNHHIKTNKQFRVDLDSVLQQIKSASDNRKTPEKNPSDAPIRSSRERSIVITKLQEAIMWLGMDLKDLDAPNPYPNSYNPSNTIVEKTADGLKL